MIKFTVYGKPIGKQRPRFDRRGGHMYTPKETVLYEKAIENACSLAMKHGDLLSYSPEDALAVSVAAYYPIPKSWSKRKQELAVLGLLAPVSKPDIDNVLKSVLDGAQGIAFDDDKQVVRTEIMKAYSNEPRVEVTITTI